MQNQRKEEINIGPFQSRSPKAVIEGSSISLKFSSFVTINEISISWKFQLHAYYQSIFVAIQNFWLFCKTCKIWVWANFRGQFLENLILRRHLVQYWGAENGIKWKNKSFLSFSWFLRRNNFNNYNMST